MQKAEIIIIGAGVLGLSLAYHLSQEGKSVIILEKECTFGSHASGKNAGMIRHLSKHSQLISWTEESVKLWPPALRNQTSQTGSYIRSKDPYESRKDLFEKRILILNNKKVEFIYTKNDALIKPLNYLKALKELLDPQLVTIKYHTSVLNFCKENQDWSVQTKSGNVYQAEVLVIANGAWFDSFKLTTEKILQPQKKIYARHIFKLELEDPFFMPEKNCGFFWDEEEKWYFRFFEGNQRLFSVCDKSLAVDLESFQSNPALREEVVAVIAKNIPQLNNKYLIKDYWHCFRAYAADELPLWGSDPYQSNLFWLAGFGGFGMSTSFAAASDAALFLCGQKINSHVEFSPVRFTYIADNDVCSLIK